MSNEGAHAERIESWLDGVRIEAYAGEVHTVTAWLPPRGRREMRVFLTFTEMQIRSMEPAEAARQLRERADSYLKAAEMIETELA